MKTKAKKQRTGKPRAPVPQSMTLYFRDPELTRMFTRLAKTSGLHGSIKREGIREIVRVTGFRNKTEYTKLMSSWATISLQYHERNEHAEKMRTHERTGRLL